MDFLQDLLADFGVGQSSKEKQINELFARCPNSITVPPFMVGMILGLLQNERYSLREKTESRIVSHNVLAKLIQHEATLAMVTEDFESLTPHELEHLKTALHKMLE